MIHDINKLKEMLDDLGSRWRVREGRLQKELAQTRVQNLKMLSALRRVRDLIEHEQRKSVVTGFPCFMRVSDIQNRLPELYAKIVELTQQNVEGDQPYYDPR